MIVSFWVEDEVHLLSREIPISRIRERFFDGDSVEFPTIFDGFYIDDPGIVEQIWQKFKHWYYYPSNLEGDKPTKVYFKYEE